MIIDSLFTIQYLFPVILVKISFVAEKFFSSSSKNIVWEYCEGRDPLLAACSVQHRKKECEGLSIFCFQLIHHFYGLQGINSPNLMHTR
jgi:hypothetical protein